MSDYSELKKLVSIALSGGFLAQEEFRSHCRASVIGRLIDENERLNKQFEIEREFKLKTYEERDALKAENESLRKVNADLLLAGEIVDKMCEEIMDERDELKNKNESIRSLLECAQGDCRQAMQIIDRLTPEAELYQQIQIAAGSLPSSWEIALRVENGYGGVDLIDPYGTVVDLDNVDESLSESVASAVAFAIEHAISSPENP